MSKFIFDFLSFIAISLCCILIIYTDDFSITRVVVYVCATITFVSVSRYWLKKIKVITPTYLFYALVLYFSFCVAPYTYLENDMMLKTVERVQGARIPGDFFYSYSSLFMFSSFLMVCVIRFSPNVELNEIYARLVSWRLSKGAEILLLVISFSTFCIVFFGGDFARKFGVPVATFYFSWLAFKGVRKYSLINFCGLFFCVLTVLSQVSWRFVFVQYAFSIGLVLVFYFTLKYPVLSFFKKLGFVLFFPVILLYGIVSEFIKINPDFSVDDLLLIFNNLDLILEWSNRQSYRIFQIWTILSGNIIEHAMNNGYYYGITYIKGLSGVLGFEYVSLPVISANFVSATYAQPGIIAEGYANFGWFGSLFSIFTFFVLSHGIWLIFMRKINCLTLSLVYAPFVSVLLDGGSINSIIFNYLLFGFLFSLFYFIKWVFDRRKNYKILIK